MGKANLYTVKDYLTGEVLAKGTAGELEASGIVPKGYHTSEWAKHENQKRRNRKYAISFEERQPEVKRGEKGRMMSVYTCYNAAGDVIGEGTARELWEAGVFSNDNAAYYTYKETGRALHKARHRKNDLPKRDAEGRPETMPGVKRQTAPQRSRSGPSCGR